MTTELLAKDSCDKELRRLPLEVDVRVLGCESENSNVSIKQDAPADATSTLESDKIALNSEIVTIESARISLSHDYLLNNLDDDVGRKEDSLLMSVENNELYETKDGAAEATCEETRIVLPEQKTPGKRKRHIFKQTQGNNTVNIFLNDLLSKKLDLNIKFSSQEITDIRKAVKTTVNSLAEFIGEIDPRLRICEVIPAGSARERTQIIRPCEYDFILILDALSKPGTVSITQANPNDANREFMRVKLENIEIRALFHDITSNGYIRGSRSLPLFRKGLRQLLASVIHQAVLLRSETQITEMTGNLTFNDTRMAKNGPAFTIRLVWESHEDKSPLDISIDLVPALKLYDNLNHVLPVENKIYSPYLDSVQNVGSALLMPREGQNFKVTFTEAEILLTSRISQHHIKCYKLMKYMVNGEPFPLDRSEKGLMKYLRSYRTGMHSYSIKKAVWDHHFKLECLEENDLFFCLADILEGLWSSLVNTGGITHPFTERVASDSNSVPVYYVYGKQKSAINKLRLGRLIESLDKIHKMHIQKYNYEKCHRAIKKSAEDAVQMRLESYAFLFLLYLIFLVCTDHMATYKVGNVFLSVVASVLNIFCAVYVLTVPRYFRRHLLTLESRRLTKSRIDTLIVLIYTAALAIAWAFYFLSRAQNKDHLLAFICFGSVLEFLIGFLYILYDLPSFVRYVQGQMYLYFLLIVLTFLSFAVYCMVASV